MKEKDKMKLLYGVLFIVGFVVALVNLSQLIAAIASALIAIGGIALMIFSASQFIEVMRK